MVTLPRWCRNKKWNHHSGEKNRLKKKYGQSFFVYNSTVGHSLYTPVNQFSFGSRIKPTVGWCHRPGPGSKKIQNIWSGSAQQPWPAAGSASKQTAESLSKQLTLPPQPSAPLRVGWAEQSRETLCRLKTLEAAGESLNWDWCCSHLCENVFFYPFLWFPYFPFKALSEGVLCTVHPACNTFLSDSGAADQMS